MLYRRKSESVPKSLLKVRTTLLEGSLHRTLLSTHYGGMLEFSYFINPSADQLHYLWVKTSSLLWKEDTSILTEPARGFLSKDGDTLVAWVGVDVDHKDVWVNLLSKDPDFRSEKWIPVYLDPQDEVKLSSSAMTPAYGVPYGQARTVIASSSALNTAYRGWEKFEGQGWLK